MRNNQNDAPLPNPLIMLHELNQAVSGKKRRSQTVYKKKPKRSKYSSNKRPIIYNFQNGDYWRWCDGANYQRGYIFGSIIQQNLIENEFNREYAPLATIQPGMAIEFTVKSANNLYLDLNNSRLHVIAKITKVDKTNIDANTAARIY